MENFYTKLADHLNIFCLSSNLVRYCDTLAYLDQKLFFHVLMKQLQVVWTF